MPKIPHLESATTMVCPQVGWQGLHPNLHVPSNPVMAIWAGMTQGGWPRESAGGAHSSLRVAVQWQKMFAPGSDTGREVMNLFPEWIQPSLWSKLHPGAGQSLCTGG